MYAYKAYCDFYKPTERIPWVFKNDLARIIRFTRYEILCLRDMIDC